MATGTLDEMNAAIANLKDEATRQREIAKNLDAELNGKVRQVETLIARAVENAERLVQTSSHLFDKVQEAKILEQKQAIVKDTWDMAQGFLLDFQESEEKLRQIARATGIGPSNISVLREARGIVADFMRALRLTYPELDLEVADFAVEDYSTIEITPQGYLKSVWSVLWNAIRHPFSETVINLQTGEVVACE